MQWLLQRRSNQSEIWDFFSIMWKAIFLEPYLTPAWTKNIISSGIMRKIILRMKVVYIGKENLKGIEWCAGNSLYQPAHEIGLSNFRESCELVSIMSIACNWQWWEYLHHGNMQTPKIRAATLFLLLLPHPSTLRIGC